MTITFFISVAEMMNVRAIHLRKGSVLSTGRDWAAALDNKYLLVLDLLYRSLLVLGSFEYLHVLVFIACEKRDWQAS